MTAAKGTRTNRRSAHQKAATDEHLGSDNVTAPESESFELPVPSLGPSSLLRTLDNSVEKRTKTMRQKLRSQHRLEVKKAEDKIKETAGLNRLAAVEYRRTQIKRLSELLRKRTEIELEIVSSMQSLNDVYQSASNELVALAACGDTSHI